MQSYRALRGQGLLFLLLLWFLWFLTVSASTLISPVLPLIEDEFLVGHARATALVSLISLGSAAATFVFGLFAGFAGYKRSILVAFLVSTVLFLLIPHAGGFSHLALLFLMIGVANGVYYPCSIPVITEHYHYRVWGKTLAIHDSAAAISVFSAPLLAIVLLRFFTWRQFYYLLSAAYVIGALLFLFSGKEIKVPRRVGAGFHGVLKDKGLWILAVIWAFAGGGAFMALYQIIPLYLTKELALGLDRANTILGLSRLGGAFFGVMMGFAADRFDLRRSMFAEVMAIGMSILLISYPDVRVVQAALFLQGTIVAGFFPLGLTLISRMFRVDQRSAAGGVAAACGGGVGVTLFPFLLGLSGDHVSFRFGIFVLGLAVTASSGLVYFLKLPAERR